MSLQKCYEAKPKSVVLFQNYCVNKAVFLNDDKVAYTIIYKKDMEKFAVGDDSTDGIAEMLRAINSTEVSLLQKRLTAKFAKFL